MPSTILEAIRRAGIAYTTMAQTGSMPKGWTFDDETQLFQWVDTETARYVYLNSNGTFNHAEGIPADGSV